MAINMLIVDDSAVTRAMIIKTIRLTNLPIGEVHQAANGKEGLAVLESNWIDLVFVDINMPVMTGEEMIERIRANPAWNDLPLIVVSTEGSRTRIDRLQQKGAKFIHKPFTPELVYSVIQEIIGTADQGTTAEQPPSLQEVLYQVAMDMFESLAFMISVSETSDGLSVGDGALCASVDFTGPFDGKLAVQVSMNMAPAIAANMLGIDMQTATPEQEHDALKELLNVVCGNLLPRLVGTESVFNVHAPQIDDRPAAAAQANQPPTDGLWATATLGLDSGVACFQVYLPKAAGLNLKASA